MSIRINLLPEARIIKLRNQKTKRLVTVLCLLISTGVMATLFVLLLLLGARTLQKGYNEKSITKKQDEIKSKNSIEKDAAWFNGALAASAAVSDRRILISQLFDRLTEAIPNDVSLTDLSVDADYKVKASVKALDFNTVALFADALKSYNLTNRFIPGLSPKTVFNDVRIDSVTSSKSGQVTTTKTFDVTFVVDKDLVEKFRSDNKKQVNEVKS